MTIKVKWAHLIAAAAAMGLATAIVPVAASHASTTGTVDYVKGGHVAVMKNNKVVKYIKTGSRWTALSKNTHPKGDAWIDLGGNQVVSAKYMYTKQEYSTENMSAKYHMSYSSAVYQSPAGRYAGRTLRAGTNWKVSKQSIVNGQPWVNLGGNSWVKRANGYFTSNTWRGNKTYSMGPDIIHTGHGKPNSGKGGVVLQDVKLGRDYGKSYLTVGKNDNYTPNFKNIVKLFRARTHITPMPVSMPNHGRGTQVDDFEFRGTNGVDWLTEVRSAGVNGYAVSDTQVANTLGDQMIRSGLYNDFRSPSLAYMNITGYAKGSIRHSKGAVHIELKITYYHDEK